MSDQNYPSLQPFIASTPHYPLEFKVLDPRIGVEFPFPSYATPGSAAIDLMAMKQVRLSPGSRTLMPTGIAIHLKNPGLVGLILPRSGLGHKRGLILGNSTGVIDSDYTGELMVSLWNCGREGFLVSAGDRIAQLLIIPVTQVTLTEVREFDTTQRGAGGFGSTGSN